MAEFSSRLRTLRNRRISYSAVARQRLLSCLSARVIDSTSRLFAGLSGGSFQLVGVSSPSNVNHRDVCGMLSECRIAATRILFNVPLLLYCHESNTRMVLFINSGTSLVILSCKSSVRILCLGSSLVVVFGRVFASVVVGNSNNGVAVNRSKSLRFDCSFNEAESGSRRRRPGICSFSRRSDNGSPCRHLGRRINGITTEATVPSFSRLGGRVRGLKGPSFLLVPNASYCGMFAPSIPRRVQGRVRPCTTCNICS